MPDPTCFWRNTRLQYCRIHKWQTRTRHWKRLKRWKRNKKVKKEKKRRTETKQYSFNKGKVKSFQKTFWKETRVARSRTASRWIFFSTKLERFYGRLVNHAAGIINSRTPLNQHWMARLWNSEFTITIAGIACRARAIKETSFQK